LKTLRFPKLPLGIPGTGRVNAATRSGIVTVAKIASSRAASARMRSSSCGEGSTNWLAARSRRVRNWRGASVSGRVVPSTTSDEDPVAATSTPTRPCQTRGELPLTNATFWPNASPETWSTSPGVVTVTARTLPG
jgi:hypothetical protein